MIDIIFAGKENASLQVPEYCTVDLTVKVWESISGICESKVNLLNTFYFGKYGRVL